MTGYLPSILLGRNDVSSELWRRILRVVTNELGYRVLTSSPGEILSQSVRLHQPDLLLLGYSENSVDEIKALDSLPKEGVVPIVFVVADEIATPELARLISAGVADCLRAGTEDLLIEARLSSAVKYRLAHKFALMVAKSAPVRDSLTGLWNHRHFHDLLKVDHRRAERSGTPLSLVMMDIDHFKKINDTHGHQAGDRCLREVAVLLNKAFRSTDIVCRYGGEEFAVILPSASRLEALALLKRVLATVRTRRIPIGVKTTLSFTLSAGLSVYPEDALSASELVRCADMALYQAKRLGRDRLESVRKKRFTFIADEPLEFVGVGGDWNAWNPESAPLRIVEEIEEKKIWEGEIILPTGINRYKFKCRKALPRDADVDVVNGGKETAKSGRWIPDHLNQLRMEDGFGSFNSIVDVENYSEPFQQPVTA